MTDDQPERKAYRASYESTLHEASATNRYLLSRVAAARLSDHARRTVLDGGFDPDSRDVVIEFAREAVSPVLVEDLAKCGCLEDMLAVTVVLAAELSVRLAVAQQKLAELGEH
jgi:hypothetical protein